MCKELAFQISFSQKRFYIYNEYKIAILNGFDFRDGIKS